MKTPLLVTSCHILGSDQRVYVLLLTYQCTLCSSRTAQGSIQLKIDYLWFVVQTTSHFYSLKAHVNFSDHQLACLCPSVCKIFTFQTSCKDSLCQFQPHLVQCNRGWSIYKFIQNSAKLFHNGRWYQSYIIRKKLGKLSIIIFFKTTGFFKIFRFLAGS